jgi:hypothetical protein
LAAIVAGIAHAARSGIIIMGGGALELLGRGSTLVLDKTGTVTACRPAGSYQRGSISRLGSRGVASDGRLSRLGLTARSGYNAIMQIDFALEAERKLHKSPAIYEGCLIRLRPIMMTTMAALLGTSPIALGYGAGRRGAASVGHGRGGWVPVFPR